MTAPETNAVRSGVRWKWLLYLGVAIGLVTAAKYFHIQDRLKQALDWFGQLGAWGVVLFIALYVVATVLFIPGSALTLGAGAVFGVVRKANLVNSAKPNCIRCIAQGFHRRSQPGI